MLNPALYRVHQFEHSVIASLIEAVRLAQEGKLVEAFSEAEKAQHFSFDLKQEIQRIAVNKLNVRAG